MEKHTKFYKGKQVQGENVVTVNNEVLPLRLDLRNHSPTGFAWGYGGSGPAQLALAILADFFEDENKAIKYYQKFKWKVIANLNSDEWKISNDEIELTINQIETEMDKYT